MLFEKLRQTHNVLLILLAVSSLFLIELSSLEQNLLCIIYLLLNLTPLNTQHFKYFVILDHSAHIVLQSYRIIH